MRYLYVSILAAFFLLNLVLTEGIMRNLNKTIETQNEIIGILAEHEIPTEPHFK